MRHETAIFGPKQLNFINSSYHLFLPVFFSPNNRKHKKCWNPYFYSVLAPKKENFQILYLKHWKLKNPMFAPFFWKRLFLENCQIIGHKKKNKMITECANQISWNHYFYRLKNKLGPDNNIKNPNLDQIITLKNPKLGPDNNFTAYIYISRER